RPGCAPRRPRRGPTWKQLTVQVRPGVDARDLAALGFDLAEVRNLDAVRYYQGLPGYRTDALPWDRLYVLVCPPAVEGAPAAWNPAADRLDPARDLTAAAGRAWPDLAVPAGRPGHCPQLTGPVSYDPPLRRDSDLAHASLDAATVVFPDGDPAARELSGRLAALAGGDARAVPLQAVSVPLAVRWQMAGAAVLPIELEFPCSCLQLAALLAHAAWIQQIATAGDPLAQGDSLGAADRAGLPCDPASLLRRAGAVRPLAITHPWLVTRGHLAGLAYDFDGTPRLAGLGAAAEPGDAP
ncbi:MAG TPA: hypothetical protein PLQ13_11365, partial [Candidatus Krumholzibacteria bacterium]|nr:hypothetical protein [Candidatus Krumholzibacteria bacterium]